MMTDEQRFIFDVQGYLVVEGVLPPERVQRMCAAMEEHGVREPQNNPNASRFGGFLTWGEDWRNLIDEPKLLPILSELLGPRFRLDHAYGMAMRAAGEGGGEGLHHHSAMFEHGCYYVTHRDRMHNGLIVVSYALTDINPGMGGFACIPGSHKALYPVPEQWYSVEDNPMVRQVPQKAGDVLIFTEALTHGTMPWRDPNIERRSVLLKYCPHYMQWTQCTMSSEIEGLTERQKLILQPPYVWQRPTVELENS
jgi:ectoine hydroxylase-related dioxygenase (phytanoyl-CoA dioxygenase family)